MSTDSETALLDIGNVRNSLDTPERTDLDSWRNPDRWRPFDDARTGNPEQPEEQPWEGSTDLRRVDQFYQQLAPSSAASGWRNIELQDHTSLDLPKAISTHWETLREPAQSEKEMYAAADAIVEWLAEGTQEQEAAIGDLIMNLPPTGRRILFSACADAELHLSYSPLLRTIARCISAHDKRLAQAATACLLLCGGAFGKSLLEESLRHAKAVPHAQLVRGIIALLNRQ